MLRYVHACSVLASCIETSMDYHNTPWFSVAVLPNTFSNQPDTGAAHSIALSKCQCKRYLHQCSLRWVQFKGSHIHCTLNYMCSMCSASCIYAIGNGFFWFWDLSLLAEVVMTKPHLPAPCGNKSIRLFHFHVHNALLHSTLLGCGLWVTGHWLFL